MAQEFVLNGKYCNQLSLPANDRGLLYGDGLFETIIARDPKTLQLHLDRLTAGLK
jgi:4-amino-4-deoxychorismate lyase